MYKFSAKTSANLLTFEKLDLERLKDFFNLLAKFKYVADVLDVFKGVKSGFKSQRLRALLTMKKPNRS